MSIHFHDIYIEKLNQTSVHVTYKQIVISLPTFNTPCYNALIYQVSYEILYNYT